MNPDTGRLYPLWDVTETSSLVELRGTTDDIANVSAAVRAQAEDVDLDEAKRWAMDEIRSLNRHERQRGRT